MAQVHDEPNGPIVLIAKPQKIACNTCAAGKRRCDGLLPICGRCSALRKVCLWPAAARSLAAGQLSSLPGSAVSGTQPQHDANRAEIIGAAGSTSLGAGGLTETHDEAAASDAHSAASLPSGFADIFVLLPPMLLPWHRLSLAPLTGLTHAQRKEVKRLKAALRARAEEAQGVAMGMGKPVQDAGGDDEDGDPAVEPEEEGSVSRGSKASHPSKDSAGGSTRSRAHVKEDTGAGQQQQAGGRRQGKHHNFGAGAAKENEDGHAHTGHTSGTDSDEDEDEDEDAHSTTESGSQDEDDDDDEGEEEEQGTEEENEAGSVVSAVRSRKTGSSSAETGASLVNALADAARLLWSLAGGLRVPRAWLLGLQRQSEDMRVEELQRSPYALPGPGEIPAPSSPPSTPWDVLSGPAWDGADPESVLRVILASPDPAWLILYGADEDEAVAQQEQSNGPAARRLKQIRSQAVSHLVCNSAALRLFGWTASEVIQRCKRHIPLRWVLPTHGCLSARCLAEIQARLSGERLLHCAYGPTDSSGSNASNPNPKGADGAGADEAEEGAEQESQGRRVQVDGFLLKRRLVVANQGLVSDPDSLTCTIDAALLPSLAPPTVPGMGGDEEAEGGMTDPAAVLESLDDAAIYTPMTGVEHVVSWYRETLPQPDPEADAVPEHDNAGAGAGGNSSAMQGAEDGPASGASHAPTTSPLIVDDYPMSLPGLTSGASKKNGSKTDSGVGAGAGAGGDAGTGRRKRGRGQVEAEEEEAEDSAPSRRTSGRATRSKLRYTRGGSLLDVDSDSGSSTGGRGGRKDSRFKGNEQGEAAAFESAARRDSHGGQEVEDEDGHNIDDDFEEEEEEESEVESVVTDQRQVIPALRMQAVFFGNLKEQAVPPHLVPSSVRQSSQDSLGGAPSLASFVTGMLDSLFGGHSKGFTARHIEAAERGQFGADREDSDDGGGDVTEEEVYRMDMQQFLLERPPLIRRVLPGMRPPAASHPAVQTGGVRFQAPRHFLKTRHLGAADGSVVSEGEGGGQDEEGEQGSTGSGGGAGEEEMGLGVGAHPVGDPDRDAQEDNGAGTGMEEGSGVKKVRRRGGRKATAPVHIDDDDDVAMAAYDEWGMHQDMKDGDGDGGAAAGARAGTTKGGRRKGASGRKRKDSLAEAQELIALLGTVEGVHGKTSQHRAEGGAWGAGRGKRGRSRRPGVEEEGEGEGAMREDNEYSGGTGRGGRGQGQGQGQGQGDDDAMQPQQKKAKRRGRESEPEPLPEYEADVPQGEMDGEGEGIWGAMAMPMLHPGQGGMAYGGAGQQAWDMWGAASYPMDVSGTTQPPALGGAHNHGVRNPLPAGAPVPSSMGPGMGPGAGTGMGQAMGQAMGPGMGAPGMMMMQGMRPMPMHLHMGMPMASMAHMGPMGPVGMGMPAYMGAMHPGATGGMPMYGGGMGMPASLTDMMVYGQGAYPYNPMMGMAGPMGAMYPGMGPMAVPMHGPPGLMHGPAGLMGGPAPAMMGHMGMGGGGTGGAGQGGGGAGGAGQGRGGGQGGGRAGMQGMAPGAAQAHSPNMMPRGLVGHAQPGAAASGASTAGSTTSGSAGTAAGAGAATGQANAATRPAASAGQKGEPVDEEAVALMLMNGRMG